MGRNKKSGQPKEENNPAKRKHSPLSNITSATENEQMADGKGCSKKKSRNQDKLDGLNMQCQAAGSSSDEISCISKPVKTYECSFPDNDNEKALVSGLKKCVIADDSKVKKKRKKKADEELDTELQSLLDFIEGKDAAKENSAPLNGVKKTKKKKKPLVKDVAKEKAEVRHSEVNSEGSKSKATELLKGESDSTALTEGSKLQKTTESATAVSSEAKTVKPKKLQRKAAREPTKEELEVMQLLQFIEGTDEKDKKGKAASSKDHSDQNNNDEKKKKGKKKKPSKEFDFNVLRDNTHLEAKMLEEILQNPSCVAEYRLFNPKQVAHLFSKGHNEHWEKFPECDGRLKALERSREGLTLCDPGNKQLHLVLAELRRAKGKNITKRDLIDALKCHAYLRCEKCGYQSEIVTLQ